MAVIDLTNENPWLPNVRADNGVRLRLFCFPYAGGGAGIFKDWPSLLSRQIDVCPVQLPGREQRLRELPYTRLSLLVRAIHHSLSPLFKEPFALFGHSMGALIAFELARRLSNEQKCNLHYLFVGGHRAPQIPDREPPLHVLSDEAFIQRLRNYSGTPEMVLEHPDFIKVFLPLLRADFAVCETYQYLEGEPLSCPLSVFGGIEDHDVWQDDLSAWAKQTQGLFKKTMLPGNHFFLHAAQAELLGIVEKDAMLGITDTLPASASR